MDGVQIQPIGSVPHASPASPLANKGWAPLMTKALVGEAGGLFDGRRDGAIPGPHGPETDAGVLEVR